MNENKDKKEIKDKVLEAIKSGRAKMKPKWHFVLRGILISLLIVIAFLTLLSVWSFTFFSLRQTGVWFAPAFGSAGWISLLRSTPWILVILSVAFVIFLEILVRRYAFAYRRPLIYSVLGLILIVVVGGIIMEPWHKELFRFAKRDKLPIVGEFYKDFDMRRFDDIHRGQIIQIFDRGFLIKGSNDDETSTILLTPMTHMPQGPVTLRVGDNVVVFGPEHDGEIQALGVAEINPF